MSNGKKSVAAAIVAVFGFFALPVSAEPTHQALLTVSGYAGTTPLVNFPVLVRLSSQTIQGFDGATCAPDGSDLLFVNYQGDNYPYEIDTWNPSGESLVWVKLPRVENGATFFVQWGGGAVAAGASVASGTWNNDYVGVWHMGEQDGVCANSTRHGSAYDATPKGATGDPLLRGRGDYPYRPASASPCAEAGRPLSWMDDNAVDFYGRPRKQGRNPDIGAAESRWSGFIMTVR